MSNAYRPGRFLGRKSRAGSNRLPIQVGALPWRLAHGNRLQVLLVTGRRSGRWMVPKGWPMIGKSLARAAETEAFEEAGIQGTIDPEPLGEFRHRKQHLLIGDLEVRILVYPLAAERELEEWPEAGERERRWFSVHQASASVESAELAEMIRQLRERIETADRRG